MASNKIAEVNKIFSANFQKALSTITQRRWLTMSHVKHGDAIKIYLLNPPLKLKSRKDRSEYSLRAHMITEIVDVGGTKDKKVRTREYIYAIGDNAGDPLLEFHWHPNKINPTTLEIVIPSKTEKVIQIPHIHIYANNNYLKDLRKKHIPSGRVAFEDVLSFLVNDLKIVPSREDWIKILAETRKLFDADKTW